MKRLISLFLGLTLTMHVSANTNIQFAQEAQKDSKHLVLFVSDATNLQGDAKKVNDATDGRLSAALTASGFDGAFGSSEGFYGLTPYQHIVVVGSKS